MAEITVIVPIYNQEKYIADCANALLAQTFTDFDVIFVDDGSTDNTVKELMPFIEANNNFTLFRQNNGGVSVARNKGLEMATGNWIAFMDPDDLVVPEYLQTLYNETSQHPNADIIMSSCTAFSADTQQTQHFFPHDFMVTSDTDKTPLYHQLMNGAYQQPEYNVTAIGVPWGKLYRYTFLEKNHLQFNPNLKRMQDNLFNMKAFHDAREIVYIDYPGYLYRIDDAKGRSYRNAVKRVYRNAIHERELLMNEYGLNNNKELHTAQQIEKTNLYFQEIRAVALTAPHNYKAMKSAVHERMKELKPLVSNIDSSALPNRVALRKLVMTNRNMANVYSLLKSFR